MIKELSPKELYDLAEVNNSSYIYLQLENGN